MSEAPQRPIIRPLIEHLFEVEDLSRRARRGMAAENDPAASAAIATDLIDRAITQLVAARALLPATTPSETSHEDL